LFTTSSITEFSTLSLHDALPIWFRYPSARLYLGRGGRLRMTGIGAPLADGGGSSVARDRLIVLVQRRREIMVGRVPFDEKQVTDGCWVERCLDGVQSRARDGAGRQSRASVGVVRMIAQEVGASQTLPILAMGVLHSGIGLQRHSLLQPVPEHGRDEPLLVPGHGFPLDNGGERQH